ncbi:hypothetical protein EN925_34900, partial [Mesorhizobium sp. M7A.F.Ca.US.006.04.2.1]
MMAGGRAGLRSGRVNNSLHKDCAFETKSRQETPLSRSRTPFWSEQKMRNFDRLPFIFAGILFLLAW